MNQPKFDGATFTPVLDEARLSSSLERVVKVMRDGQMVTLASAQLVPGDNNFCGPPVPVGPCCAPGGGCLGIMPQAQKATALMRLRVVAVGWPPKVSSTS